MIECITVDQFMYFISLLGDIVTQIDSTVYMINAEVGTVYWQQVNESEFCRISY